MTAVENCPEAGGATYMLGIYKIPMARMWLTTTDKNPDVRVKKKKWQKCHCRDNGVCGVK
jgi:hypothetical protein